MRLIVGFGIVVLSFAACTKRTDRGPGNAERHSADTVVTKRQMQDTAIIRHDTTITTDTTHKRGTRPVKVDTTKKR